LNDTPYTEVTELSDLPTVRTHLHNGWFILEIYKKKVEVYGTHEFEEQPVYIMGNPAGG
jgi:hypothetical protein